MSVAKPNDADERVFEHDRRAAWGIAVVSWETDDKRGYLFSDGQIRVVARSHYDLMREVSCPSEQVELLLAQRASERLGDVAPGGSKQPPGFDFELQLRYFLQGYPHGFASPQWQQQRRGQSASTRLKRHRDPALRDAREKLARPTLDGYLTERAYSELWREFVALACATDALDRQAHSALSARDEALDYGDASKALRNLLYGVEGLPVRFDRFLSACRALFKGVVSWPLATLPLALVFPNEHVCVQPSSFREQARVLAPRLARAQSPSGVLYARYLELARTLERKLAEAGFPPADLWDVGDFVRLTTSPRARKAMLSWKHEVARQNAELHAGSRSPSPLSRLRH